MEIYLTLPHIRKHAHSTKRKNNNGLISDSKQFKFQQLVRSNSDITI